MTTNLKKLSQIFLSAGAIQYVIISSIAMLFYPGGSNADPIGGPYTVGYDFFGNYFSDLGRTIAINGMPNPIASILYYIANLIYALCLIPFFLTISSEFPMKKRGKGAGIAASIFGIIAGLGTFTYAVTPSNLYPVFHNIGVGFGYSGTFLAILMLGIAMHRYKENLKQEGLILIILAIVFFITLTLGPILNTVFTTMLMQKTSKYLTMIIFTAEGILWFKRSK
ncbi:MAG: hypothetical protein ACTSWX_13770 [Promethearchaeota archaeon]